MPTARNARGIDIIAYGRDASHFVGIQVKTLSKRDPVPVGSSLDSIMGDYWIVVDKMRTEQPRSFILSPSDVKELAHRSKNEDKGSYWIEPPKYDQDQFQEAWDRIGRGNTP